MVIRGNVDARTRAKQLAEEVRCKQGGGGARRPARAPAHARTHASHILNHRLPQVLADDKEEHFYVERRYHGWLIGPRGSRIREIEAASGTRVVMSREEPVVIVQGSRARREKA